jgi:MFS family permease
MPQVKTNRILLTLAIALFWFAQYVYIPFQTPYLTSLRAQASLIGIVVGAYGLTQTLLRIPLGIFADRYSRHKMFILAGLVCSALASVLRFLVPTPGAFLAANMLSGVASAMWISFTVFYASLYGEGETKKAMGYTIAANSGGILLAFIAGALLHDAWSIREVFTASIVAGALGALVALFIREPKAAARTAPPQAPLEVFRSKPLIAWSLLGASMQAIVLSTALSFTASWLKQFTDREFLLGVCSVIFIAASVAASFTVGHIKRNSRALLRILFGFLLLYCALMPLTNAVWQICLLQVAAGIGNGGIMPLLMTSALHGIDPRSKSTAMGFFQAVYGVGMTLGPMLMGALIGGSGYPAGYWAMALLALVSIAALQLFRKNS